MGSGDDYRARAKEFLALAEDETNPRAVAAYQTLARSYLRLAEQADRNQRADIVCESPPAEPIIVKPVEPPLTPPEQIERPKEANKPE